MPSLRLKSTHKAVSACYDSLAKFAKFIAVFEDFCSLCRSSLNPNISFEAVEEMIIQHILTERIFRKIFAVADFISHNLIVLEIEKVISALNSRVFSRDDFNKSMEQIVHEKAREFLSQDAKLKVKF
jgi:predicted helicase